MRIFTKDRLYDAPWLLSGLAAWFSPAWRKTAFFGAFLGGLLCHMKGLTSMLLNHDGMGYLSGHDGNDILTSGRWCLRHASLPSTSASLPWLIGLLSLLYIALAAVLVAELLELRYPIPAGLCGVSMAAFPVVTSTFSYIYTADAYFLALLLSVLAVYALEWFRKWYWGVLFGGFFLGVSMGIYQAYLSVTLVLMCLMAVLRALRPEQALGAHIRSMARQGLMCLFGAGVYWLFLTLRLRRNQVGLVSYQGIDQIGSEPLTRSIPAAWMDGVRYLFLEFPQVGGRLGAAWLVYLSYLALGFFLVYLAIRGGIFSVWWRAASAALFTCLVPVGISIVRAASPGVTYAILMRYSVVLLPVFLLSLGCRLWNMEEASNALRSASSLLPSLLCAAMIFNWTQMANFAYLKMDHMYENTYAIALRISDRVLAAEGYTPDIPLFVQSPVVLYEHLYTGDSMFSFDTQMSGTDGAFAYNPSHFFELFNYLLGVPVEKTTDSQREAVLDSDEFAAMPVWPAEGSVAVIDGIMVVKTVSE